MARADSIPSFPADIDRNYFAAYLSGFTDGEGHFELSLNKMRRNGRLTPTVRFNINLRADDLDILRLIQAFFGCGIIHHLKKQDRDGCDRQDQFCYRVDRIHDLVSIMVPHFIAYPLLAKKRRDFEVWRQGVALAHRVFLLPYRSSGRRAGRIPKWTQALTAEFRGLVDVLRATRRFNASAVPLPPPVSVEPSLFDLVDPED